MKVIQYSQLKPPVKKSHLKDDLVLVGLVIASAGVMYWALISNWHLS